MSFVIGHWSFVIGPLSLVICHWSFVLCPLLFVNSQFPIPHS
ncbi:MAG: D-galactonate transporter [Symploca sp. SIO2G7]|nr:D-galactonate transporter [Symploca sp. SIO2G7]